MRYFLLMLLLFPASVGYSQALFPRDSITVLDSINKQEVIDLISANNFKSYTSKRKIPEFIKRTMNSWRPDGQLKIGGLYETDTTRSILHYMMLNLTRPPRQLVYLGKNEHFVLLVYHYNAGRFCNCPSLLFRVDKEKILQVWTWLDYREEIKTKEEVVDLLKQYPGYDRLWL